jgi:hypothetical protein
MKTLAKGKFIAMMGGSNTVEFFIIQEYGKKKSESLKFSLHALRDFLAITLPPIKEGEAQTFPVNKEWSVAYNPESKGERNVYMECEVIEINDLQEDKIVNE